MEKTNKFSLSFSLSVCLSPLSVVCLSFSLSLSFLHSFFYLSVSPSIHASFHVFFSFSCLEFLFLMEGSSLFSFPKWETRTGTFSGSRKQVARSVQELFSREIRELPSPERKTTMLSWQASIKLQKNMICLNSQSIFQESNLSSQFVLTIICLL